MALSGNEQHSQQGVSMWTDNSHAALPSFPDNQQLLPKLHAALHTAASQSGLTAVFGPDCTAWDTTHSSPLQQGLAPWQPVLTLCERLHTGIEWYNHIPIMCHLYDSCRCITPKACLLSCHDGSLQSCANVSAGQQVHAMYGWPLLLWMLILLSQSTYSGVLLTSG